MHFSTVHTRCCARTLRAHALLGYVDLFISLSLIGSLMVRAPILDSVSSSYADVTNVSQSLGPLAAMLMICRPMTFSLTRLTRQLESVVITFSKFLFFLRGNIQRIICCVTEFVACRSLLWKYRRKKDYLVYPVVCFSWYFHLLILIFPCFLWLKSKFHSTIRHLEY